MTALLCILVLGPLGSDPARVDTCCAGAGEVRTKYIRDEGDVPGRMRAASGITTRPRSDSSPLTTKTEAPSERVEGLHHYTLEDQMSRTRHTWTDVDNEALLEAIEACEPLREHYANQRGTKGVAGSWWDAVAGRLAPGLLVTGAACRNRYRRIEDERQAALAAADAAEDPPDLPPTRWDVVALQVEEYERTVGEVTLDTVTETAARLHALDRSVQRIERMVLALCREWDVEPPL